ncbi:MAG: PAS domain S-box protein [Deltaproteobacteria bacterium]|nr:PAS domain S-box protein [Deltaproteobacteria bacterium]
MKEEKPKTFTKSSQPGEGGEIAGDRHPEDAYFMTACSRLSGERYQAFVENIGEGVYEVDIHGNFLYFNNSLCRIFGYSREEIQFQSFAKFMDEGYAERTFKTFNRIYRTGRGFSDLLWKIIDKEGKERYIELSAGLITNREGERIGFRGIVREVTEKVAAQEALRRSEKRYRTLLDFVPYPIVVFSLDGRVTYLNPAFTETFGWTLEELAGKTIPYVPPDQEMDTKQILRRLLDEKIVLRHETRRLTKDGRVLDVVLRAGVFSESSPEPSGELVILRDITQEKRIARNNDAMLRLSTALPEYPELGGLLDYVSSEIQRLLGTEGAQVILLDEEKDELFFHGASHEDSATEKRMREIRFPASKGVAGRVVRTGLPVIVPDTSKDPDFYNVVDRQAGFSTKSLLDVPLRSKDRIIGVLCAMNKKEGSFDETDVELLNTIAGTVALSIENARYSKELQDAYREVSSLNRAKDRVINHLSHELKTPLSVLSASLNILGKRLSSLPPETWEPTLERARRNLERILEIQYQVEDIMRQRHFKVHSLLSALFDECRDALEALAVEQFGEGLAVEKIRERLDKEFGVAETAVEEIYLDRFVPLVLKEIEKEHAHRAVEISTRLSSVPPVCLPPDAMRKVLVGLVKNAVENTPDEGEIEVAVRSDGEEVRLEVRDYGVGITDQNQARIFDGFFTTQETMDYSSKKPYDFNAGGKGGDLLRAKIFSERYGYKIQMTSERCGHIPRDRDICPGRISMCGFCRNKDHCRGSGGTTFTLIFRAARGGVWAGTGRSASGIPGVTGRAVTGVGGNRAVHETQTCTPERRPTSKIRSGIFRMRAPFAFTARGVNLAD